MTVSNSIDTGDKGYFDKNPYLTYINKNSKGLQKSFTKMAKNVIKSAGISVAKNNTATFFGMLEEVR